ncbi:alpha/beta fold hydrolase [Microbacter sp. GSS18]|nr:alpha/beta fold hydrolase [Microbacter sp. GSS18]
MTDRHVVSASGRRLGVTVLGDPAAPRTIALFTPMPGAAGFDPDPLETRRSGVRIVTVDRPGYGGSEPIALGELATFGRHADDVARHLRRAVGAGATVGVVGWGVGGHAAAALAGRHPDLVDRLALVDTPASIRPGDVATPYDPADLCIRPDEPSLSVNAGLGRRVERMLADAALGHGAGFSFDRSALRSRDWAQTLRRIDADTVLLYGSGHPLVSAAVDGARLRRRIRGARVVRVPDAAGLAIGAVWPRILDHVAPASA